MRRALFCFSDFCVTIEYQRGVSVTELIAEDFLHQPGALGDELESAGALQFRPRASGLFAASDIADEALAKKTGMGMAWFRDNAHVANALSERGRDNDIEQARGVGRAFLQILQANEQLLWEATRDPDAPRLPVRVQADTLANDSEQRFQNDSTGYSIWLPAKLMLQGLLRPTRDDLGIFAATARYLEAGKFWQQADEGQWEEDRQIHASSIGVAVASLGAVAKVFDAHDYRTDVDLPRLINRGRYALDTILAQYGETPPTGDYPGRQYDASHLFLVESLRMFDATPEIAAREVRRVEDKLVRSRGVIRYPGDSYYAPGFTEMLAPGERTSQAEGRLERRNTLGSDAERTQSEAQWKLFDSLLSSYWGRRYEVSKAMDHRRRQLHYLNRLLAQYIEVKGGGLRIPELDYKEKEISPWTPNDHVPLIWAQANTLLALKQFEVSV